MLWFKKKRREIYGFVYSFRGDEETEGWVTVKELEQENGMSRIKVTSSSWSWIKGHVPEWIETNKIKWIG